MGRRRQTSPALAHERRFGAGVDRPTANVQEPAQGQPHEFILLTKSITYTVFCSRSGNGAIDEVRHK
jgi:hypothetical protein